MESSVLLISDPITWTTNTTTTTTADPLTTTSSTGSSTGLAAGDRNTNLSASVQVRLKKKMAICYDRLFNCAIVVLPAMFILPILVWSFERLGLVSVPHGSRLETVLSYYFVLCWATMFSFSFLFCARSLCEADLRDAAASARSSDAAASATMPVHVEFSSNMDCSDGTVGPEPVSACDLPPSYEEATGQRPYVAVSLPTAPI